MRTPLAVILALIVLLSFSSLGLAAERSIEVDLDGTTLKFDQNPVKLNNRVLVPLRAIFEALGAKIEWKAETQTIKANKGDIKVQIAIGATESFINGKPYILDQPPIILNGRTLVPVRFVSEAVGARVAWDSEDQTVLVFSKEKGAQLFESYELYFKARNEADLDKKMLAFQEVTRINPNHAKAYNQLGIVLRQKKLYDSAIENYNKALGLRPDKAIVYNNRGVAYLYKRSLDLAMQDFIKANELEPADPRPYMWMGAVWTEKRDFEKAKSNFDKAIELDPTMGQLYDARGNFYRSFGELDKAKQDFETACNLGYQEACKKLSK